MPYKNREDKLRWQSERRASRPPEKDRYRKWYQAGVRSSYRNARRYGALSTLTPEEWKQVVEIYNFRCYLCGCSLTVEKHFPNTISLEHKTPLSEGGANVKENVAPACLPCNRAKSNRRLSDFVDLAKKWASIHVEP